MAENPAAWSKATFVISETLDAIHRQNVEDIRNGDFRAGFSTPMQITRALQDAGYLTEEALTSRTP